MNSSGKTPVLTILLALGLGAVLFMLYSNLSGQKYIGTWTGTNLPFETTGTPSYNQPSYQPELKKYPIGSLNITVQENLSNSYSAYTGTAKFFPANTNFNDPTVQPIASATFSSGAVSETSWNKTSLNTAYDFVLDGGGTWYDEIARNFVFDTAHYNEQTGAYSLTISAVDPYPFKSAPTKIGTLSATISNASGTGCSISGSEIDYNKDVSGSTGSCSFDLEIKNTAANTLIRNLVLHPQNDVTNALEGNEIQSVTISKKSGNLTLPVSTITSYFTNYQPLPLGNLTTADTTTFTISFTFNESNLDDNETLYLMLDDLGGYLANDVVSGNKGMAFTKLTLKFTQ